MEPTPAKPVKKLRRWLIVALFVGKWQVSISDGKTAVPVFKVTDFRNAVFAAIKIEGEPKWLRVR